MRMQDRYLFKAKRIKDGQWVDGAIYMEPYTDRYYIIQWNSTGLGFNEFIEVDGKTICQCTGLKDRNGNLIWENDIVKHYNDKEFPENYSTSVILWDADKLRFCKKNVPYMVIYNMNIGCSYEVIGNTFDNPELLEV